MANIFEKAKFGDKFRTRDGRTAVYIKEYYSSLWGRNMHELLIENEGFEDYESDGRADVHDGELPIDIIGKWQEPINEEELDRLAMEYIKGKQVPAIRVSAYNAYRVGYRKAKESSPN